MPNNAVYSQNDINCRQLVEAIASLSNNLELFISDIEALREEIKSQGKIKRPKKREKQIESIEYLHNALLLIRDHIIPLINKTIANNKNRDINSIYIQIVEDLLDSRFRQYKISKIHGDFNVFLDEFESPGWNIRDCTDFWPEELSKAMALLVKFVDQCKEDNSFELISRKQIHDVFDQVIGIISEKIGLLLKLKGIAIEKVERPRLQDDNNCITIFGLFTRKITRFREGYLEPISLECQLENINELREIKGALEEGCKQGGRFLDNNGELPSSYKIEELIVFISSNFDNFKKKHLSASAKDYDGVMKHNGVKFVPSKTIESITINRYLIEQQLGQLYDLLIKAYISEAAIAETFSGDDLLSELKADSGNYEHIKNDINDFYQMASKKILSSLDEYYNRYANHEDHDVNPEEEITFFIISRRDCKDKAIAILEASEEELIRRLDDCLGSLEVPEEIEHETIEQSSEDECCDGHDYEQDDDHRHYDGHDNEIKDGIMLLNNMHRELNNYSAEAEAVLENPDDISHFSKIIRYLESVPDLIEEFYSCKRSVLEKCCGVGEGFYGADFKAYNIVDGIVIDDDVFAKQQEGLLSIKQKLEVRQELAVREDEHEEAAHEEAECEEAELSDSCDSIVSKDYDKCISEAGSGCLDDVNTSYDADGDSVHTSTLCDSLPKEPRNSATLLISCEDNSGGEDSCNVGEVSRNVDSKLVSLNVDGELPGRINMDLFLRRFQLALSDGQQPAIDYINNSVSQLDLESLLEVGAKVVYGSDCSNVEETYRGLYSDDPSRQGEIVNLFKTAVENLMDNQDNKNKILNDDNLRDNFIKIMSTYRLTSLCCCFGFINFSMSKVFHINTTRINKYKDIAIRHKRHKINS